MTDEDVLFFLNWKKKQEEDEEEEQQKDKEYTKKE